MHSKSGYQRYLIDNSNMIYSPPCKLDGREICIVSELAGLLLSLGSNLVQHGMRTRLYSCLLYFPNLPRRPLLVPHIDAESSYFTNHNALQRFKATVSQGHREAEEGSRLPPNVLPAGSLQLRSSGSRSNQTNPAVSLELVVTAISSIILLT